MTTASSSFIDLSAFSELEGFLYGGRTATTWFVGSVQKSNWFSIVPLSLRQTKPDFEAKSTADISRSGDYVLNVWFRVRIPKVQLADDPAIFDHASVRWCRKLGHNLFNKVTLSHNDLNTHEFTSNYLDFHYQYFVNAGHRLSYRNMIGDTADFYNAVPVNTPLGSGDFINVPLPFWFAKDSGRALPVAAIPFNETKVNYDFRSWKQLLIVYPGEAGGGGTRIATVNDVHVYGEPNTKPYFDSPETFATYAVVHNDERLKMGDKPRDILITGVQQLQSSPFNNVSAGLNYSFDIRFANAIFAIFFAAENTSIANQRTSSGGEYSNYTTQINYDGDDPIETMQLLYENQKRVEMGADYFSMVSSYYHSDNSPDETGYHLLPYALNINCLDPCGSTNFTKITNVTVLYTLSRAAVAASNVLTPLDNQGDPLQWPDTAGVLQPMPQSYRHVLIALNHNIARIGNGSIGYPTL